VVPFRPLLSTSVPIHHCARSVHHACTVEHLSEHGDERYWCGSGVRLRCSSVCVVASQFVRRGQPTRQQSRGEPGWRHGDAESSGVRRGCRGGSCACAPARATSAGGGGGRAQSSCALADMQPQPQQEEEDTGALILLVNEADKLVLESADADSASSFDVPAPVFLRSASRRSNSPACCSP